MSLALKCKMVVLSLFRTSAQQVSNGSVSNGRRVENKAKPNLAPFHPGAFWRYRVSFLQLFFIHSFFYLPAVPDGTKKG